MAEVLAVALTLPQARELQRAADEMLEHLTDRDDPRYSPDAARALRAAGERLHFVRAAHDRIPARAPGEPEAGRTPAIPREDT